jgi:hypothetical protein
MFKKKIPRGPALLARLERVCVGKGGRERTERERAVKKRVTKEASKKKEKKMG